MLESPVGSVNPTDLRIVFSLFEFEWPSERLPPFLLLSLGSIVWTEISRERPLDSGDALASSWSSNEDRFDLLDSSFNFCLMKGGICAPVLW